MQPSVHEGCRVPQRPQRSLVIVATAAEVGIFVLELLHFLKN